MPRQALTTLAVCAATLLSLATSAAAQDPIPDPSANRTLSGSTNQACYSDPSSAACTDGALADINAARASEGVVPMTLPGDYASLTVPQELLALANLERVDRGLAPIEGLSSNLDGVAQSGAAGDTDPFENPFPGSVETANWEGGYSNPLESDFGWIYDDGLGSNNLDCTPTHTSECWGHRHDTLWDFSEPAVMGAAYDPKSPDGPSQAELFVGGDTETGQGQADAPIAPTWAAIAATLTIGVSAATLRPAGASHSAQLTIWASGEAMNVTAAVTSDGSHWSVSPAGCMLAAGKACVLTTTATTATPGNGTLTLTGPNGTQTIALSGTPAPVTKLKPKITASLKRAKLKRGKTTTLKGAVSPFEPGWELQLQRRKGKSWVTVATAKLASSSSGGRFTFTIKGRSTGSYAYRIELPAGTGNDAATSATVKLKVYVPPR